MTTIRPDFENVLGKALEALPGEYLQCRDLRHLWHQDGGYVVAGKAAGGEIVERSVVCTRCGTSKVEKYLLTGVSGKPMRMHFLGTAYKYPAGYLLPEMSRSDRPRELLRAEEYRRWVAAEASS